jgi:hypothetical protein
MWISGRDSSTRIEKLCIGIDALNFYSLHDIIFMKSKGVR